MLGAVKKRSESDFSANRPYSLTITVLTVSENYFLHFDRDFFILNFLKVLTRVNMAVFGFRKTVIL